MMDIHNAILTEHALKQMKRRGITRDEVQMILSCPEEILTQEGGRIVAQSIIFSGSPEKEYLLRVIVDSNISPPEVVTVYRTSKISKYRSQS